MIFIHLFALFLLVAGISLLIKPGFIIGLINSHRDRLALYIAAIVMRLILGGLLLVYAGLSPYPLTMQIIGLISILAAFTFTVIGWPRFKRLMAWVMTFAIPYARVGGLFSFCFGVFLLYAFL